MISPFGHPFCSREICLQITPWFFFLPLTTLPLAAAPLLILQKVSCPPPILARCPVSLQHNPHFFFLSVLLRLSFFQVWAKNFSTGSTSTRITVQHLCFSQYSAMATFQLKCVIPFLSLAIFSFSFGVRDICLPPSGSCTRLTFHTISPSSLFLHPKRNSFVFGGVLLPWINCFPDFFFTLVL